jgi:hypothetical protein
MNQQHIRIIRKVEYILIKSSEFRIPGKKELLKSESKIEIVVIDVTETSRERPKKNRKGSTVVKSESTH